MHNWNLIWAMFGLVAFLLVLVLVVIYFGGRLQIPPRKQRGSSGTNPQTPSQTPAIVNPAPVANAPATPAASARNLSYVLGSTLGFIVVLAIFAGLGWFLWLVVPPGFRAIGNWAARIGTTPSANISEQKSIAKEKGEISLIAPVGKWSKSVNVVCKRCNYVYSGRVKVRLDGKTIIELPTMDEIDRGIKQDVKLGSPLEVEFMSSTNQEEKVIITWEKY